MKMRTLLIAGTVALAATAAQAQELVAGWDFSQYYTAGRLSTDGSTGVNTLDANYSSLDASNKAGAESADYGTLLMNGSAGSSAVSTTFGLSEVKRGLVPGNGDVNIEVLDVAGNVITGFGTNEGMLWSKANPVHTRYVVIPGGFAKRLHAQRNCGDTE